MIIEIIATILSFGSLTLAYVIAKQGPLKKIELFFTPSKEFGDINFPFFFDNKKRIPVISIFNFFKLKDRKIRAICTHIYLTIFNGSKHPIEDVLLTLTYPSKFFDKTDPLFLSDSTSRELTEEIKFSLLGNDKVQITFKITNLNPMSARQFIHPFLTPTKDFEKELNINDPMYTSVSSLGYSFTSIDYSISAKTLKKSLRGSFWVISINNITEHEFFKKEKIFIDEISKNTKQGTKIIEIQKYDKLYLGKFKNNFLVGKIEESKLTYSYFKKIIAPEDSSWNFEKK